jgi:hypothetical protein
LLEGGVLISTNFGPRPPSFIVSLMQALCPPLSHTRIATLEKRKFRNYGSITSWFFNCFIPCFVSTLEMILNFHLQTLITTCLLWESMKKMKTTWSSFFDIMVTHPITLGCGWEKSEVQSSSSFMFLGIFICTYGCTINNYLYVYVFDIDVFGWNINAEFIFEKEKLIFEYEFIWNTTIWYMTS